MRTRLIIKQYVRKTCYGGKIIYVDYLNQARTSLRLARTWFLEIVFVQTLIYVRFRPQAIKNGSREMKAE